MVVYSLAVETKSRPAGEQSPFTIGLRTARAEGRSPLDAVLAFPTLGEEDQGNMVTRLDRMHAGPDFLDYAGSFMPRHNGHRPGTITIYNR